MGKNSKEEISEYVEENFNNDDCSFYINWKKVTLVNLIIDGIDYFTKLKMKKEREKQKKKIWWQTEIQWFLTVKQELDDLNIKRRILIIFDSKLKTWWFNDFCL